MHDCVQHCVSLTQSFSGTCNAVFRRNPQPFIQLARELYPGLYKPTVGHYFITLLHKKGLLLRCFT
jgi:NAD-dependent SIR2 family protein deacetylase